MCMSPKSLESSLHGERQEVEQGAEGVQLSVFGKEVANAFLGRDGVPVISYAISHFSASVAGNLRYVRASPSFVLTRTESVGEA